MHAAYNASMLVQCEGRLGSCNIHTHLCLGQEVWPSVAFVQMNEAWEAWLPKGGYQGAVFTLEQGKGLNLGFTTSCGFHV